MKIKMQSDEAATVWLYEEIGEGWFGGISAKTFAEELKTVKDHDITLRINSPGGDVFDGVAMHSLLRDRKRDTKVVVDGIAASAASVVAMGGDSVEMALGSTLMIHSPWSYTQGTAADFRKLADTLDAVEENIVDIYERRTLGSRADIREMMQEETWMSAEEAVEEGFADGVGDALDVAANITKEVASKYGFEKIPGNLVASGTLAVQIAATYNSWRKGSKARGHVRKLKRQLRAKRLTTRHSIGK